MIALIILVAIFGGSNSDQSATQQSSVSDEGTAKVEGEDPPAAVKEDIIKVSAVKLSQAYQDNEAAGDATYKGKKIEISGTIGAIQKDMFDETSLSLKGANYLIVTATLDKSEEEKALKLKKGQKIVVVCTSQGEVASIPVNHECVIK